MNRRVPLLLALSAAFVAGCAGTPAGPAPASIADAPPQWQAARPDAPASAASADARGWWQQFDDPLVASLVDAAQAASPDIVAARARIAEARATRSAAGAALLPSLDLGAGVVRSKTDLALPTSTTAAIGVQALWEIDLFGAGRASRDLANARLAVAEDQMHGVRVAVAAEAATSYVALRACEAQLAQDETDRRSRAETERLTGLSAKAGFQSTGEVALARAGAAQARSVVTRRRAACDQLVKALVELTASDETALRTRLQAASAKLPQPAQLAVASVPAEALAQRPDLAAAAQQLAAAAYDITRSEAARYPRVMLFGSIGAGRYETGMTRLSTDVWSIGPLSVTLPIFDAGRRAAEVDAAYARADEAAAAYRARLRRAVREVETALVTLQGTADRAADAKAARDGYQETVRATDERYRRGMASLFDLEDARRLATQAESALIDLQSERTTAWIDLYRALGGGWPETDAAAADGAPHQEAAR